ncbi:MAG: putative quinol monooxygenase [Acidobacteriota bacterium]
MLTRRDLMVRTAVLFGGTAVSGAGSGAADGGPTMYGLIGQMNAVPGEREKLARILLDGTRDMPGCLSYVIALDGDDENVLWITEVWESEAAHQASLQLESVQAAIAEGRPLIAGFGQRTVTTPLGGHGLATG